MKNETCATDGLHDESAKAMAARLVTYDADSITAFAFVQSVALGYALGGKDFLSDIETWTSRQFGEVVSVVLLIFGFYLFIVLRCHAGENTLSGTPSERANVGEWTTKIRHIRITIVTFSAALAIAELALVWRHTVR